jgi:hypothetical protein
MVLSLGFVIAFIGSAVALLIGILVFSEVSSGIDCPTATGHVDVVAVTLGGNYTSDPTVAFNGGGGSGATGDVTTGAIANGFEVTAVTVTSGGGGYSAPPIVSFVGGAPVTTVATATAGLELTTSDQGSTECEDAKDTAWTVIGILPVALFFALFAIFGALGGRQ